jgi:hypothetical protein
VKLSVYDLLGREVRTLVDEDHEAGRYAVQFHAADLPSGLYFYKIAAGDFIMTRRMYLLK